MAGVFFQGEGEGRGKINMRSLPEAGVLNGKSGTERGGGEGSRSIFLSLPKSPPEQPSLPFSIWPLLTFRLREKGGTEENSQKSFAMLSCHLEEGCFWCLEKNIREWAKNPKGGRRWKERAVKVKKGERKTFFPPRFFFGWAPLHSPSPLFSTPLFPPQQSRRRCRRKFFLLLPFGGRRVGKIAGNKTWTDTIRTNVHCTKDGRGEVEEVGKFPGH